MKKEVVQTIVITYIPGLGTWLWVYKLFPHVEPVTLICNSKFDNFYKVIEKVQYENTKDYVFITNWARGACTIYINVHPLYCHTARLT